MKINMKVMTSLLLALVLTVSAFAAFEKQNEYTDGLFADVPAEAWYAKEVKSTYELGLMNGKGAGMFSPSGNVTVAEAITLCARVNSIYNGVAAPTNSTSGNWYDSYVAYGIAGGFVKEGQFADYNALITRAQMAELFYDAMPDGYYNKINNITAIPDVDKNAPYYAKLLALYNAGIVMGSDEYGTYNPASNIVRSEVAAIINRVAVPANRKQGSLKVDAPVTPVVPAGPGKQWKPTIFHIDDVDMDYGHGTKLTSGWKYKNLGEFGNEKDDFYATLTDTYSNSDVSIIREITPIKDGTFMLETEATTNNVKGGFYYLFTDKDNADILRIYGEDGVYKIKSGDKIKNTGYAIEATCNLKVVGDFEKKTGTFYVNGKYVTDFEIASPAKEITRCVIGTTVKDKVVFTPYTVTLVSNYLILEKFSFGAVVPADWSVSSEAAVTRDGKVFDTRTIAINAKSGENQYIAKTFEPSSGKYAFETLAHTPHGTDGVYFTVKSGDKEAFTIKTKGNTFVAPDGTELRTYSDNVCQTLRIVADTATKKATAYVNGKNCGEFSLVNNVDYFDSIQIGINAKEDITLLVDDVQAFPIHEFDDYVPVPVPAESKNYEIGTNVCNIWRNGYHFAAWQSISNFSELEPVLGFYDEGNPEVSDWEIKFWAEHGVDYQAVCWYNPSGNLMSPIKGGASTAIEQAYFHAKYSDMVKFALLWENNGGTFKEDGFERFKKYVWPYWVDYYFSDDRYMKTVDGKAVITGWVSGAFINDFGGVEGTKTAINWMNEEIKKYGYTGVVIFFYDQQQTTNYDFFKQIADAGITGTYAYSLGQDAWNPNIQINRHKNQRATSEAFVTASIGVGYNSVGWHNDKRYKMINLEDYEKVCLFMRDEFLPEMEGEAEPWKSRMVFLSTWNEFGEGHYIMPCGEGHVGFGYLDTVRNLFTDSPDTPESNVVPTAAQKARINQLYPQDHAIRKRLRIENKSFDNYFCESFVDLTNPDLISKGNSLKTFNHDIENGVVSGESNGNDYNFHVSGLEFQAENVPLMHIHAKMGHGDSYFEVFFSTKQAPVMNQANSQRVLIPVENAGEWADYYFDMSVISGWTGTVTGLRVDPSNVAGTTFEIDLIEFMVKDKTKLCDISVDGTVISSNFTIDPVRLSDGTVMVATAQGDGLFSRMCLYSEFSRKLGTLYLESKDHSLLMTVDSDKAIYDGKEITMPFTYKLRDGIPYISLGYIAEMMGHKVEFADSTLKITTENYESFQKILAIVPFEYEFDIDDFTQDWNSENADIGVQNGKLSGEAFGADSALVAPELKFFDYQYNKLEVRMKMQGLTSADVYFSTDTKEMGEETKVTAIAEPDKDGYSVLTFDFSANANWTGMIQSLKFKPFSAAGLFEIDYIRFIENPDMDPSLRSSVVKYGDAETPGKFPFLDGADKPVPITTDPEDPNNHCYVISSSSSGYKYFVKNFIFEPGATYRMEFDIRIKGTNGEAATVENVFINGLAQYADPSGVNHAWNVITVGTRQGWVHANTTFTVKASLADESEETRAQREKVIIYSNPVSGKGVDYYVDNFKVTKIS